MVTISQSGCCMSLRYQKGVWKYVKHPICDIYAFGDIKASTKEVLTENAFKA